MLWSLVNPLLNRSSATYLIFNIFKSHFNSHGCRNVVVLHPHHDLIIHRQLGCFLDGRKDGCSHQLCWGLDKADQDQVRHLLLWSYKLLLQGSNFTYSIIFELLKKFGRVSKCYTYDNVESSGFVGLLLPLCQSYAILRVVATPPIHHSSPLPNISDNLS